MSPVGSIFVPFPPKTGTNMLHPLPLPIVELVKSQIFIRDKEALSGNTGSRESSFLRACNNDVPKIKIGL